jgi:16S rRNA (adenine1518-N6/adenine1519-N6)-dimethyltransferase
MIKPKKSLGQNFLIDKNIIQKIINMSDIKNNNVLEIGPGTGNLTSKILEQKPKSLILIEKDSALTLGLKKKFKLNKNVKIFNENILKFNIEEEIKDKSIIIGNLPYNISSQILTKLIKFKTWLPKYKKLVLMFQKEVADKIIAKPGSCDFGRLSVITSSRLKIVNSFIVSPNSFFPVPKIKSKVLVLEPIINQNFKVKNINNLEKITHDFFSKKRKMINKVFKKLFKNYKKNAVDLNINLKLRPNALSDNDYYNITRLYEKSNKI